MSTPLAERVRYDTKVRDDEIYKKLQTWSIAKERGTKQVVSDYRGNTIEIDPDKLSYAEYSDFGEAYIDDVVQSIFEFIENKLSDYPQDQREKTLDAVQKIIINFVLLSTISKNVFARSMWGIEFDEEDEKIHSANVKHTITRRITGLREYFQAASPKPADLAPRQQGWWVRNWQFVAGTIAVPLIIAIIAAMAGR